MTAKVVQYPIIQQALIERDNIASEFQNHTTGDYQAIGFDGGQLVHTDGKILKPIGVLDSLKWEISREIEWAKADRLDSGSNVAARAKWLRLVRAQL